MTESFNRRSLSLPIRLRVAEEARQIALLDYLDSSKYGDLILIWDWYYLILIDLRLIEKLILLMKSKLYIMHRYHNHHKLISCLLMILLVMKLRLQTLNRPLVIAAANQFLVNTARSPWFWHFWWLAAAENLRVPSLREKIAKWIF